MASAHVEVFEERLAALAYVPYPEYEQAAFLPGPKSFFFVRDNFPRLLGENIPSGIEDVRYSIRIDYCGSFRTEPDWDSIAQGVS